LDTQKVGRNEFEAVRRNIWYGLLHPSVQGNWLERIYNM